MRILAASAALSVALGLAAAGCEPSGGDPASREARLREIERRMEDSLPKTEQIALAQRVDAGVVRRVQSELGVLQEYLDEPSGKLDAVTVNAIEAFQRRARLRGDGLLDARTLDRLAAAAAAEPARATPSPR